MRYTESATNRIMITEEEVAVLMNVSRGFLRKCRMESTDFDGPPFFRIGSRLIRYNKVEVVEWMKQWEVNSLNRIRKGDELGLVR